MLKDYFNFSARSLRKRGVRSWLTMIGIFIGIAAIVSLIGLGEGLRTAITGQFGFLGTDVLSIQASGINFAGPPGQAVVNPLDDKLKDKIERINGVEAAVNRYIESATLEFNDQQVITFGWSVPDGNDRKTLEAILNLNVEQGRLLKDGDGRRVLLGSNYFLSDDDFGRAIKVGNNILISGISYEVVGMIEKKGSFIFDSVFVMNEETMLKDLREKDDEVNAIGVKVKNEKDIPQIKANIEELLRKERNVDKGEEDFEVQTPQAALSSLNSTLFAVQLFVYLIAAVSLLVGGIGIMNTMYTSVLERTKEIGIMKSIGATNNTIFTIFFIESGLLGMVGGGIGVIVGLIISYGIAAAGRAALGSELIQASIGIELIIGALLFSFIVGLIAGTLPAIQAAKKHPVDALRFVK